MPNKQVTDYWMYRHRYLIGYGLTFLLLAALLVIAGLWVPGGLTNKEMASVVTSQQLTNRAFWSIDVINLPYHALQFLSLKLLGPSIFAIKLPSLLLALATGIGMVFLLRRWFRYNVSVIATIIAITTGQFLFFAQNGTPSIIFIFWTTFILLSGTMASRRIRPTFLWKGLFFLSIALSLYTPLSMYLIVALFVATIIHPHLRFMVRRLSLIQLILAILLSLIVAAPLIIHSIKDPAILLTLAGWGGIDFNILQHLQEIAHHYFSSTSLNADGTLLPIFGLATLGLMSLGIVRLATTRYTAKSYIMTLWLILLFVALLLKPGYFSASFVPSLILIAFGLDFLFHSWYRLFPLNPYARVAGLLPLAILVGSMGLTGVELYYFNYRYSPSVATVFSTDLRLAQNTLADNSLTTLLVSPKQKPFYEVVVPDTKVVDSAQGLPKDSTLLVSRAAKNNLANSSASSIKKIITAPHYNKADRFYIYKYDL